MKDILKILLAGEGGQGIQSIAEILAEAANDQGKEALYIPNFGVEQRGGVSMAYLQITDRGRRIGAPKFEYADVLIALSPRAVTRTKHHVNDQTLFIYDNSLVQAAEVNDHIVGLQYYETTPPCPTDRKEAKIDERAIGDPKGCWYKQEQDRERTVGILKNANKTYPIPANDIAKNDFHPRVFNVIILGTVVAATKILPLEAIEQALRKKLGDKFKAKPELEKMNLQALKRGYELIHSI